MSAVSFQARIIDGKIILPPDMQKSMEGLFAFVYILPKAEKAIEEAKENYSKSTLKALLRETVSLNLFKEIKDPVEWQKSVRDEWE